MQAEPSSTVAVVAKSVVVGVIAMIVSVIAFLTWILIRIPKNVHGPVGIDVLRVIGVYWPALLGIFLAGFILKYLKASRRCSMLTGGMAQ